ncbi:hypothetical protein [Vulcanococcus sp.]|jgi:hypothetical protein|uniref:hypothetical protein n=1 Tax=Vulcanococcus sp. TaxID=2856995 RepID=UPI0037D9CEC9
MKRTTEKLPMYISCRVVLNDEQRQALKQAYRSQMDDLSPQPARIGGSTVTTQTAVRHPIERELPGILLTDLLSTRESLPLDTVIRIQRAFGVEVITPKDVLKQAENYTEFMFRDDR